MDSQPTQKTTESKPVKERKRQWAPKSRNGCLTCKTRKVKCDEAKPDCERCSSTGRTCEYASDPSQRQTVAVNERFRFINHPLAASLIPGVQLHTDAERENLSYFEHFASAELCGPFASRFWRQELLQAAQVQPVIRYAVIALGAMHRKLASGTTSNVPDDPTDAQIRFALQQSNRAIQELVKPTGATSPMNKITILASSVLFLNMACIQGLQMSAIRHLRSGLKLLSEIDEESSNMPDVDQGQPIALESLRTMLVDFDVQARLQMSMPHLLDWEPPPQRGAYHTYADSYSPADHAQIYLETLLNHILSYIQSLYRPVPGQLENLESTLAMFKQQTQFGSTMLDDLDVRAPVDEDESARITRIGLRIMCRTAEAYISIVEGRALGLPVRNGSFRRFSEEEEQFIHLYDLATQLIQLTSTPPSPHRPHAAKPTFSTRFGAIPALWIVAVKGPNFSLRRKAVKTLLHHQRREGLWDGPVIGRVAEYILSVEEQHAREQGIVDLDVVPTPQEVKLIRCADIVVHYMGPREVSVNIRTLSQVLQKQNGSFTHITW